jgi:hypothetical protein
MEQQLQEEYLSIEQYIELLASSDRQTQYQAYTYLYSLGSGSIEAAIKGLSHSHPQVRRWCADLMDHFGDDRCISSLLETTKDVVPHVRRQAVHSISCQRCKSVPLQVDLTERLILLATTDQSMKVRQEAVFGLSMQPMHVNTITTLRNIIAELTSQETKTKAERVLLRNARYAFKRQMGQEERNQICRRE